MKQVCQAGSHLRGGGSGNDLQDDQAGQARFSTGVLEHEQPPAEEDRWNTCGVERVLDYMPEWNQTVIDEFRANEGKVGGNFTGAPIVLVHHTGRSTGREFVAPMMYQAAADPGTIYVFASKAGAPTDPDWYKNLIAAGHGEVEVGVETYPVTVSELTGEERDRIYAEQARRYPGFADYEKKTAGFRVIPVLALARA